MVKKKNDALKILGDLEQIFSILLDRVGGIDADSDELKAYAAGRIEAIGNNIQALKFIIEKPEEAVKEFIEDADDEPVFIEEKIAHLEVYEEMDRERIDVIEEALIHAGIGFRCAGCGGYKGPWVNPITDKCEVKQEDTKILPLKKDNEKED